MTLRTIVDTGQGPYRVTVRIDDAWYRALYSKSDWNKILRASLLAGGMKWLNDYLPLRFQNYARAMLGYNGMKKGGLPLVLSGRLRAYVLTESSATATARGGTGTLILNMPTPTMTNVSAGVRHGVARTYAANPVVNQVLSAITDREVAVIDRACQDEMEKLILGSKVRGITSKGGDNVLRRTAAGMSLTGQQRKALSQTVQERKRISA